MADPQRGNTHQRPPARKRRGASARDRIVFTPGVLLDQSQVRDIRNETRNARVAPAAAKATDRKRRITLKGGRR